MKDKTLSRPLGDNPPSARLIYGVDVREGLKMLPDQSVQMVATSPPYWGLKDYGGVEGQLGLEATPEDFVAHLVEVFREISRVLRDDGVVWLNLGDTYNSGSGGYCPTDKTPKFEQMNRIGEGSHQSWRKKTALTGHQGLKRKDLVGIPWETALALRKDGWYLRSDIIWSKGTCMPEPVRDRPSKSHEYVFLLSKADHYYYDQEAVRAPSGRNLRTVWQVNPRGFAGAHFATWPKKLVETMVKAGSRPGDMVLDPFCGSGTTGEVAWEQNRNFIGLDLNEGYYELAEGRLLGQQPKAPESGSGIEDLFG